MKNDPLSDEDENLYSYDYEYEEDEKLDSPNNQWNILETFEVVVLCDWCC